MNSDGLPNKSTNRAKWAHQFRANAESRLKRTSIQSSQPGFQYAPRGKSNPPKASLVPNTQAFTDRYAQTKQIARYVVTGGQINLDDGFDLHAFVYTPSTRLRCRVNIYFEADGQLQDSPVFLVQPTWRIMNMARNPFSGRESELQQLYPASATAGVMQDFNSNVNNNAGTALANLPDSFTLDNAGEVIRCDVLLSNGQFNVLTFAPAGVNCFITATWEPNVFITPEELAYFYRDCKLAYGNVPQIQKGVVP